MVPKQKDSIIPGKISTKGNTIEVETKNRRHKDNQATYKYIVYTTCKCTCMVTCTCITCRSHWIIT